MSTIPCYRERLRAMIFRLHFNNKIDEIKPVSTFLSEILKVGVMQVDI